jgi:transposase InsO family protein
MSDLCRLIWCGLIGLFRSRAALEAEILVLRHQLNILRRKSPKRVALSSMDRLVLVGLYRLAPGVLDALKIIRPETLIRWHRAGFRAYWRWKSRPRGGRPTIPVDIRRLIREMSVANPLWGAPRIHGELLKLGIDVGQTTVAKYMARRRMPPSQGWRTFLRNHADGIASMDLFLVPTISFRLLYGFLILRHSRREFLWLGVTAHPNAEWIARQLTEAYGWQQAPRYIVRDRDRVYGGVFARRLRAMGIRDRPIAPRSPWQNGCAERLIGSIRRDCLDHAVVFGEPHLRHLLKSYQKYYNEARTHLSLQKDAPIPRAVQTVGQTLAVPILGGLHHQYIRA